MIDSFCRRRSESGDSFRGVDGRHQYGVSGKALAAGDYAVDLSIDGQSDGSASSRL